MSLAMVYSNVLSGIMGSINMVCSIPQYMTYITTTQLHANKYAGVLPHPYPDYSNMMQKLTKTSSIPNMMLNPKQHAKQKSGNSTAASCSA